MMTKPQRMDLPPHSVGASADTAARALPFRRSTEFVLTETPRNGEPVAATMLRLAEKIGACQGELLSIFVFGAIGAQPEIDRAMRDTLGEPEWPVTWVDGASCTGGALAGVQAFVLSGRPIKRVRLAGRVVGSVYEDADARHCHLGGLGPTALELRPPAQVQQTLGNLEWALDMAGFTLADVVRTWFYNEDIVPWYGDFNRVRSAHYSGVAWRTGSIPASTGIGASNPAGAALTVAAWAVQPLDGESCAFEVGSPLQCPAPAYGSAFSRAMEISSGGVRRLLISGTASIHPDGRTAWIGNANRQIDLTMEVVGALLQSRGMDFRDITRATAYFEHPLFQPYFSAWCSAHHLDQMPVVHTHCDICRDDLLFELELDACVTTPAPAVATRSAQESPTAA